MTKVYGQIESLKRIKETLRQKGIYRFNSLGDIKKFKSNYELELQNISHQVKQDLEIEIQILQTEKTKLEKDFEELKTEKLKELNDKIGRLNIKYQKTHINYSNTNNVFTEIYYWLQLKILKFKKSMLDKYFDEMLEQEIYGAKTKLEKTTQQLNEYTLNKEKIIVQRSSPKFRELDYIKEVIEDLEPLIAGAVGEHLVEKELKKLSGNTILFNDFSIDFSSPIYNRKEDDRIYSIQIDHLLVTNAGLFIIETKNWSKTSIENLDLRSPVEQINRTNFALFVLLNNNTQHGIHLNSHHWGAKQIPIRNVVVIIKNKPKEQFKFVQVKTLKELNSYITYFEPIFDDQEVYSFAEYLKQIKN